MCTDEPESDAEPVSTEVEPRISETDERLSLTRLPAPDPNARNAPLSVAALGDSLLVSSEPEPHDPIRHFHASPECPELKLLQPAQRLCALWLGATFRERDRFAERAACLQSSTTVILIRPHHVSNHHSHVHASFACHALNSVTALAPNLSAHTRAQNHHAFPGRVPLQVLPLRAWSQRCPTPSP